MALEDITGGAEENYQQDRAESLGLEDIDELENLESLQDRIQTHRSLIISQDKRIEDLEDTVESMKSMLSQIIRDGEYGSRSAHTSGMGNGTEQRKESREGEGSDDSGDTDGWSIDLQGEDAD